MNEDYSPTIVRIIINSLDHLHRAIDWLTNHRREWKLKTIVGGWEIDAEGEISTREEIEAL